MAPPKILVAGVLLGCETGRFWPMWGAVQEPLEPCLSLEKKQGRPGLVLLTPSPSSCFCLGFWAVSGVSLFALSRVPGPRGRCPETVGTSPFHPTESLGQSAPVLFHPHRDPPGQRPPGRAGQAKMSRCLGIPSARKVVPGWHFVLFCLVVQEFPTRSVVASPKWLFSAPTYPQGRLVTTGQMPVFCAGSLL